MSDSAVTYEPQLPEGDWALIRAFVLAVVEDVDSQLPYPSASTLHAVTHHVDWCVNTVGLPLSRADLFRRDVIAAAVATMPTAQTSTRGRRRSLLLRVGEALGTIPVMPALPPLSAATPSTPYTRNEVDEIYRWASTQSDKDRPSAFALAALGLGAGLATRDLAAVRARDVRYGGAYVRVSERDVPVLDEWVEELRLLAFRAPDKDARLFRPGVAWSKNVVTVFVGRSLGSGMRPSTQRMRATWLVHHLSTGTPMQDLLNAAGLQSMDALVRYERFLPPSSAAHEDTWR